MPDTTDAEIIKTNVFIAAQILIHRGLCEAFGHVSARIPGTGQIVITPQASMALVRKPGDLKATSLRAHNVRRWKNGCTSAFIAEEKMWEALPGPIRLQHRHSAYWVNP